MNLEDRIANLSPAKRALLERKLKSAAVGVGQAIPRRSVAGPAPLSFAQERLWFLDQLEPQSRAYNQPRLIRLKGSLDSAALRAALNAVVARHEVLRTTFRAGDEHPVQVVGESRGLNFPTIDLSSLVRDEQEAKVQEIVLEWTERRFDLSRDLMLRGALLRLGPAEHILLLITHHIASDGWSGGILWRELVALYGAFSKGEPDPLPALEIQYADYAVWQRQWLQGSVLENQLSYWKRQLSDLPVLELLTDRPRPPTQSYRGARQTHFFPRTLSDGLQALGRNEGATFYMVLLAAFQTLLYRYTGQVDIAVGSPIAGRARPEIEGLIGFFVNMLVLRNNLSDNPTFKTLLTRVRKTAFEAYDNQDVPFEKLVAVLQPERDLSRSPLFQVMFAFQNVPRQSRDLPSLTVSPVEVENETAKYDLSLYMWEEPKGLVAKLEYNTDLFESSSVRRMLGHFETLLEAIVNNPQQRIAALPIIDDGERKQLIQWNETYRELPSEQSIHQLFEAQAARSPDSIALVYENQQLTYRELNARANQLAHYLRALGVGPEALVGICMERSLEMVVGVLGALKAGGAYVPLDPSYPEERLRFMLEDSNVHILITQKQVMKRLPKSAQQQLVLLDAEWKAISTASEVTPILPLRPDNLAYVIYTSGSTGQPKGVQIPHRAVVNFLNSMGERPAITSNDTLLAVTTLSFDIAGLELYLPLLTGAKIVLASSVIAADGLQLLSLIDTSGATLMQATPATWRLLLEVGWRGNGRLKVLCGGESLPADLAQQLLDRAASVWNMYGPTETTIWSAIHQVEPSGYAVPVGRPIDNTQIYILDSDLNPVPIGVPGELHIGGLGLARGYRNRPELTAERFIPDPFSKESASRLYKTGDLARYLPDGSIECMGRLDQQVKIRGFRIELGEIEAVIRQHLDIQQAVVADRAVGGDKHLIGYLVTEPNHNLKLGDLREFLRKKLPEYMIPAEFIVLEQLPLTPNGKVDRRALPTPDVRRREAAQELVAPRDLVELELARIWGNVLNIGSLGIRDNFFDLGGHSLLAVRLFAHIEQKFKRKLPLATLFEAPTIEQMSKLLGREDWSPSWSSLVPIQPNGSKPAFFCVHAHGGNVLNFNDLARHLGRDQPFFGLQAQGLDGSGWRHTSIEAMASHYLNEIREVQPSGPYLLGGYCFGGKVAFEMAQQLIAKGEKVALLALIDAFAPGYRKLLPWGMRRLAQIEFHWRNLRKLESHARMVYVFEKGKRAYAKARNRIATLLQESKSERLAIKARTPRIRPYHPKVYPGTLTIFAPMESHSGYIEFESHLGWKGLASGGMDIHEIPGQVAAIIVEPYVRDLAKQLRACIERTIATEVVGEEKRRYDSGIGWADGKN